MTTLLLPLLIALVAGFISLNLDDALAVFFAMIALISLLVSLILTPWFVKALVLAAVLGAFRYYCYRHACDNAHLVEGTRASDQNRS